jgi:hypothetical protein
LVGSTIGVRGVVEAFFHGEAGRRLMAHTLRTAVIPREVGLPVVELREHLSRLLRLGSHAHQKFIALHVLRRSHEVHQELGIVVVTGGVRAARSLARGALALTYEVLEELIGTSRLRLRSGSENLLNMLGRRSAHGRAVHSAITSVLLERRPRRGHGVRSTSIGRRALRGSER